MHKVFASYAHVDNRPAQGQAGWVSQFIANLCGEVDRRLGRPGASSLWMDFQLKGNDEVTPTLEQRIDAADILLMFFSKGWQASEWCRRELARFCQDPAKQRDGRIFLVELDGLKETDRPGPLCDLKGYRFWGLNAHGQARTFGYPLPHPDWCDTTKDYFAELYELADDLAGKLGALAPPPVATKATVYLAPVHDALLAERKELLNHLRQFGIACVPASNALDLFNFKAQLLQDLASCSHFIQLLDANENMGIPIAQAQTAGQTGKPILQWHRPGLDKTQASPAHGAFLEQPTVKVAILSEFAAQVRLALEPQKPEPKPVGNGKSLVFVHASPEDLPLAKTVAGHLRKAGHGIAVPRYDKPPDQIQADFERKLKLCTALLLVQHDTPDTVVEDYLVEIWEGCNHREQPLFMRVCRKPGREDLQFSPPQLQVCPCLGEFEQHCAEQFLRDWGGGP